jgi:CRP-like cAMP-binding protein
LSPSIASGSARFVGPLDRILYLRSLPSIGEGSIEDLASMAEYLEERTFRKGQALIGGDGPVGSIHFVVSGMVRATFREVTVGVVEPPVGVGLIGFLSRQPSGYEAIAEVDTRTLAIDTDALVGILEDRFALMYGGIRQLSAQLLDAQKLLPEAIQEPVEDEGDSPPPLDLVERLVRMSNRGVFANSNLDAVMAVARRQVERRWQAGERIWNEGDPADCGFSIRHGRVRCWSNSGDRSFSVGVGFGLGFIEGLAGVPRPVNAEAETEVVALIDQISTIVDVLEDNSDMAFDLSASLATYLLERLSAPKSKSSERES